MANKLKRTSAQISFTAESGFSSQTVFKSEGGQAALDACKELARILAISGEGEKVIEAVRKTVSKVTASLLDTKGE